MVQLHVPSPQAAPGPGQALGKCVVSGGCCRTFLLRSTADGEGVPLVASDCGDVQVQVVPRPIVEERGPLDEEMSDLREKKEARSSSPSQSCQGHWSQRAQPGPPPPPVVTLSLPLSGAHPGACL